MLDNIIIGQRIRNGREKLGLSRQEFAELVALSDYYIGQLERGERQMSLNSSVNISNCLHISLDYLILGIDDNNSFRIQEEMAKYNTGVSDVDKELSTIIGQSSTRERKLIAKLIKTILPYMDRN